jgi:hypothetical protein
MRENMEDVFVLSAVPTPIGKYRGGLAIGGGQGIAAIFERA